MFLIDFEKKGNVIRLYFGEDKDYWGSDWDDKPYEHNAEIVSEDFVTSVVEFAFPTSYSVIEPADDWHYEYNSPYSKEDMKNEKCPCLIILNQYEDNHYSNPCYSEYMGSRSINVLRIYFNTEKEDLCSHIEHFGGTKLLDETEENITL